MQTKVIQVIAMDCQNAYEAHEALVASWWGEGVIATYQGRQYRLFEDVITGDTHSALMIAAVGTADMDAYNAAVKADKFRLAQRRNIDHPVIDIQMPVTSPIFHRSF